MGDRTKARTRPYSTINVKPEVKDELAHIKDRKNLPSYNDAIWHLMGRRS